MKIAYVDSSYFVAIALGERGSNHYRKFLESCDQALSCGLLEAEVSAALAREKIDLAAAEPLFTAINWVFPDRRLAILLRKVFSVSRLRGADAYHLACALWVFEEDPSVCSFLSLDQEQKMAAQKIGFS